MPDIVLLRFYTFSASLMAVALLPSVAFRHREMVRRSLTLLVLLHLFCLAMWLGALAFTVLIALILSLGLCELSRHVRISRPLFIAPGLAVFLIMLYQSNALIPAFPLFLAIAAITFLCDRHRVRHPVFLVGFALFLLAPAAASLVRLFEMHVNRVISLLFLLQWNNVFGLLFGKLFGRTHLFKTISPGKTLEGYLSGGVGVLLGLFLLHSYIPVFPSWDTGADLMRIGVIFLFGNAGDLLFSTLKRKLDIKDFGRLLPGHGGVLDRFDDILFVTPIFYLMAGYGLI